MTTTRCARTPITARISRKEISCLLQLAESFAPGGNASEVFAFGSSSEFDRAYDEQVAAHGGL